jgi:hypothetical protein
MIEPTFDYDETADNLGICFASGEHATYLELTDHILLRVSQSERRAIGITFLDYSILAQRTEFGLRRFPLTGLSTLSPELCELALELLAKSPVSDYLALSAYSRSIGKATPIVMIRAIELVKSAA